MRKGRPKRAAAKEHTSETPNSIQRELRQAHQRVIELGRTGNEVTWTDVQSALGRRISPRTEDREAIVQALALFSQSEKPDERRVLEVFIRHAITQNALYRTQAMHAGWPLRLRLQELVARMRSRAGKRLEIVGRGENKVGFLADYGERVRAGIDANEPPNQIVEKTGYPTDMVMQIKHGSGRRDQTWYVEVEPHGTRNFGPKTRRVNAALDHRFEFPHTIQQAYGRALAHLSHQWPREFARSAVVFYTGTHPLLSEALKIYGRCRSEVDALREPSAATYKRDPTMLEHYKKNLKERFDNHKPLEVALHELVTQAGRHPEILQSSRPVYWLVPTGEHFQLIDLKRLFRKGQALRHDADVQRPVPKDRGNRVTLEKTAALSLEKLQKAGVLKTIGRIKWGEQPPGSQYG